jgi:citrate synthase
MRGITALYTDISSLDPNEGIRFRGYSIPEINQRLPKFHNEVIPEALLWLLMSGEIPTKEQTMDLSRELR